MKLLLLVSSLLATSVSTTSALQTASPQPSTYRPVPSQLRYSHAADLPEGAFLEENMRQLGAGINPAAATPSTTSTTTSSQPTTTAAATTAGLPNMMEVSNLDDFNRLVKQEASKLTVVRFHAPFCRACKAMAPQLDRFARLHPEINFVQIAWNKQDTDAKQLITSLNVNKVPHGQVYHPTLGLVEEANLGKKYFPDVAKIVESYQAGACELPGDVNEYSNTFESPYATLKVGQTRLTPAVAL